MIQDEYLLYIINLSSYIIKSIGTSDYINKDLRALDALHSYNFAALDITGLQLAASAGLVDFTQLIIPPLSSLQDN